MLISGAARLNLAGRRVQIRLLANRAIVATTPIGADGAFATTAPLPPRRLRGSNATRYQAIVGATHSSALKLYRRMYMTSAVERAGKVHLAGYVTGSFSPGTKVTVSLRVTCQKRRTVATTKLSRPGTWSATVPAPAGVVGQVAVYRARTTVLSAGHPVHTFKLPRPPVAAR